MLGIARDKAYLNNFYKAKPMKDKTGVVDKYAREKLDMTADIDIKDDDKNYLPVHTKSPLSSKFCQVSNKDEDFCAKTAWVIIVTSFVCKTTRKVRLVLARVGFFS